MVQERQATKDVPEILTALGYATTCRRCGGAATRLPGREGWYLHLDPRQDRDHAAAPAPLEPVAA